MLQRGRNPSASYIMLFQYFERKKKDHKLMKRSSIELFIIYQKWTEWKSESRHKCDQALNWFSEASVVHVQTKKKKIIKNEK